MANYSQMLGSLAAEKAVGATKSFAKGAKQAFLNETQGISSIAQFAQTAREQINVSNRTLVEQRKNNVISLEMVKELRRVNANISKSNVIAIRTAKAAGLKNATAGIAPTSGGGGAGGGDGGGGGGVTTALIAGAAGGAGASVLTIARAIAGRIIGALLGPAGLFVGGAFALSQFGPRAVSQGMSNRFNTKSAPIASTGTMGATPQQQSEARAASSGGLNFGIPIGGSGVEYIVTSRYGMRNGKMHKGIDLASKGNKPALAIASEAGKVIEARSSPTYGNFVKLEHSNGMHTLYAHLGSSSVYTGRKVVKGETLGTIGNTGTVDGPTGIHLHFEVHRGGNQIDPESVINFGGLPVRDEPVKNSDGNQFRAPPDTGTGVKNVLGSFAGPGVRGVSPSSQSASIYDFAPVGANLGAGTQIKTRSLAEQFLAITAKQNVIQTQQLVQANKNLKTLNVTTARAGGVSLAGGSVARRGPPTQDQLRERYYRSQLESARQSFLSVTQRLINTTLLKTFFPRGFGVTRQQSLGMGYVGNLIGNEIGLTNKITGVLSKAFGKQYGQAYGQIFGRLGNVFIDKAANEFSKSIGFNPEDPTKFTFGQILGNFLTKGTKQQRKAGRRMGLEQLIYNYTGIPLGPSSLLSFLSMNPAMAGFRSMMGMTGNPMQYAMNPALALQQMSGAGANYITNPLFAGITGGFNMIPGGQVGMSMMQVRTVDGQRMYASQAAQANIIANEQAYNIENQTSEQKGFFQGLGDTFMGGLRSLGTFLTGGSAGNLFSGGGSGGAGGGGGDFFSNIAGAGANMLAMYGGYKIMQKIGGKNQNPLVTMLGTMAISQGLKIGAGMALDALGYGAVAKTLGLPTALPSFGGATTGSITGAGIGSAGAAETGLTMAGGAADSAAAYTASLGEFGVVPGFGAAGTAAAATGGEAALIAAESGIFGSTVGATATTTTTSAAAATATEGIIATAAEFIPPLLAVYAIYRAFNYFLNEKGDTRITYSIYVKGNNDVNAGAVVHQEKVNSQQMIDLVTMLGKSGFAMIKKIESSTGVGPNFDYLTVQISVKPHRRVELGFNNGTPGGGDRKKTPIKLTTLDVRKPITQDIIKGILDDMGKEIAKKMSETTGKSADQLTTSINTMTAEEAAGTFSNLNSNVQKFTSDVIGYDEEGNPIMRSVSAGANASASGTNLTLQQVQNQNDELKNSNPSTATTNAAGNGTAVVNSGNVIDNSNKTTIINQRLYDDNIVQFGAFTGAEYGRVSYNRN
jgi:murein DD-endopeptidase MepM/ murein hydrolase activator NlpD